MNARINAVCVLSQPGLPAFAVVARLDENKVAVVDTISLAQTLMGMVYRTRPMESNLPYHLRSTMGDQEIRTARKRIRRIRVFGEGALTVGSTLTLRCDNRTETYACGGADANNGVLIFQEFTPAMLGRLIDVTLNLNGTGIVVRDIEIEYVFVG